MQTLRYPEVTLRPTGRVSQYAPGDTPAALAFFYHKLCYESDPSDVYHDWQDGIQDFVVIDARSRESYAVEHVPGARNIPHKEMNHETTAVLPHDKILVVYCDGIGCNASTKGAAKLAALGFKTKEMIGGLDWWKRDGYTVENGPGNTAPPVCGCN
ncbi:rhodanese-like domain-containing protein [Adhaeribacter swui]|uniref:Rhodanese-like domain-containing protein n=1 Tax=Adhaeribacter swui TaxID=2086471 RepID=A0A7G7G6U8_9BACT|nr:rhodanese-like domain-containing protein [Adhaeribacter swui]QNF32882.1 rhodanese-like domain-containing protein [Adhaeribacter swui]